MSRLRTTLEVVSGNAGYEIEIDVDYSVYAGFAGSYFQPPEPASASILAVSVVIDGKPHPAPWLCDLIADDDDILAQCLADDADRAEYAADCKADEIREERALARGGAA